MFKYFKNHSNTSSKHFTQETNVSKKVFNDAKNALTSLIPRRRLQRRFSPRHWRHFCICYMTTFCGFFRRHVLLMRAHFPASVSIFIYIVCLSLINKRKKKITISIKIIEGFYYCTALRFDWVQNYKWKRIGKIGKKEHYNLHIYSNSYHI